MVQRKRINGAGLLVVLSLLIFLSAFSHEVRLWADEGESPGGNNTGAETAVGGEDVPPPLELRLETSPANPTVNNPWTISILVNHPRSAEVNVKPPRFPPSLILERVRSDVRALEGGRWTRVEFLFTPQKTGIIALEPFGVTVQGQQAETAGINVRFREETQTVKRYNPRFRWVNPVPPLPAGERGEIFLELTNWDPEKDVPRFFLHGRAPRNAILDEGAPSKAGEGIVRYPVSIIPLEGNKVTIDPISFQAEGYTLAVPEITVPVLPAPQPPGNSAGILPDENEGAEIPKADNPETDNPQAAGGAFPAADSRAVFPLFRGDFNRITANVKTLWENKHWAEALAEIRRNERDNLAGPFLVPLRKEMEQELGLGFTDDERWQPLKISLVSWVVLVFLIISVFLILFVFRRRLGNRRNKVPVNNAPGKNVTSARRSGFKTIIVLVISIGLAVIFLEEGLGNFLVGRLSTSRDTAVLEKTQAYRIPDIKGAVNARFDEGQPVTISDFHLDWCYAETADGRSGWVKREAVITY